MYPDDGSEGPLGRFFIASILLHALLFVLYPLWLQDVLSGASLERGGVVEVIALGAEPFQHAAAPRRLAQPPREGRPQPRPAPRENDPAPEPVEPVARDRRPQVQRQPEPPKPNPITRRDEAAPQPRPQPVPPVEEPTPQPEPVTPLTPVETAREPLPAPVATPVPDPQPNELLTSTAGTTESPAITADRPVQQAPQEAVPQPRPAPSAPYVPPREQQPVVAPTPDPAPAAPDSDGVADDAAPAGESEEESEGTDPTGDDAQSVPPLIGADMVRFGGFLTYPKIAQDRGFTGTVVIEAVVSGGTGRALSVRVAESSGYDALDQAAERFVRNATRFEPADSDYRVEVEIVFQRTDGPGGRPAYEVDVIVRDHVERLP